MNFEFASAQRIIFGAGKIAELPKIVSDFGRTALVVVGRDPARMKRALDDLERNKIATHVYSVASEPSIETISEGAELTRKFSCDLVISIGGGSVIDSGKAIAAMATNPGSVLDYLEVIGKGNQLSKSPLPFIAVPTTAGTGSEVTRNAVIASLQHRVKASMRSPLMLARVALVDPDLIAGVPPLVAANTGLDALTQLIEPFISSRANPMTDAFCREGISKVANTLPNVCGPSPTAGARQDMALGSLLGGLALANAGLGVVHGFAGPIGGRFPQAAHGAICAALLAAALRINYVALKKRQPRSVSLKRFDELAPMLTGSPASGVEDGLNFLTVLSGSLNVRNLAKLGVHKSDFADLIQAARKSSSMKANPIELTDDELRQILEESFE